MLTRLLSDDLPRSRLLMLLLIVIVIGLAGAPFLFPGSKALNVAVKISIFIVLAASYDVLLGYTGIVSFAHTLFYGIGAYGVGIALYLLGPSWAVVGLGFVAGIAAAVPLALVIGLLSLRVKAIFFAMITLAVASAFAVLASQLSEFTGGEDGRNFRVPEILQPGFKLGNLSLWGVEVNGRILSYYLIFFGSLILFLILLRIVNSPFGRVLQAIRENPFRAEALGYRTVIYRTFANALAALAAALAGGLWALWLRHVGPDTTLSFSIMMDILLMVVIGGMGTLYGAILGATLFILAQNYLQNLMGSISASLVDVPVIAAVFHPDRWLLWLGILFILSVYFFPTGIVGRLRRDPRARRVL
ncbi:MAG: branched-chain amino acid ABC transporter permease [Alphaproteobacteria bacterium]